MKKYDFNKLSILITAIYADLKTIQGIFARLSKIPEQKLTEREINLISSCLNRIESNLSSIIDSYH